MASLLHRHYGSWSHQLTAKDVVKYVCIAVVALLGIAGLMQSISGGSNTRPTSQQESYGKSVYTKQ